MSERSQKLENESVSVPMSEMIKSPLEFFGVHIGEKPEYVVLSREGEVELRSYPELTLAQVSISGDFDSFRERAFRKLAGYIFGKNIAQEKVELTSTELSQDAAKASASEPMHASEQMPMTTPVFQQQSGREWVMSFVLPKKYSEETAPIPTDESVKVVTQPERTVAVLTYSGNNTAEKVEEKINELRKLISESGSMSLVSDPFCAQYDAPFTIPFLKTNEVQAEVRLLH